ncbi:hypothetical protein [Clostridium perfringens]|uniref:hypothetical protein n=1 Tax=Clostridium perfringens TaxID=1502 RepID=UPI001ABA8035|nr:hypothetical protein [Clostridium perfringens]MBO3361375.1 hypothetical protein [Clostridium perfringens]HBI6884535.1 hypothetical protein [Clostridium perfringens]
MKYKGQYTKALVIVHGKSEEQICKYIKSNLKLKMEIYKNTKSSIQINDLKNLINNQVFKSKRSFLKTYDDIEVEKGKLKNFKIFIIMDTDDCTKEAKEKFINKSMFKNHWAEEYIVPIYNNNNLEDAMKAIGIDVKKDEKRKYLRIFPTDKKYLQCKSDIIQIENMIKDIQSVKNSKSITNLDEFLDYCLKCTECLK